MTGPASPTRPSIPAPSLPVEGGTGGRPCILVLDSELQIRRALRVALGANGYDVVEASDGESGLALIRSQAPDLVIVDWGLPRVDAIDLCRRVRDWSQVPVIVLSDDASDSAKVRALDAGADDYVTKPFSLAELLARMRVALRRAARAADDRGAIVRAGGVEIDLVHRLVKRDGQRVHLTPREYSLLRSLAFRPDRVVTHAQLLRSVFGANHDRNTGALRFHVSGLRKKLESDPSRPRIVVTEPGIGYCLATG